MQTFNGIVDLRRLDIWRYQKFYGIGDEMAQFFISDQRQDFTPLEHSEKNLWIKREDKHPLGSHKGRSLAYQLSYYQSLGENKFVLSSSGNAAIAFLALTPSAQSLAFVSPQIDKSKLAYLQTHKGQGQLIMSNIAPTLANLLAKKFAYRDLRPSRSPEAIMGLSSIGYELWEQLPELSAEYAIVGVTTSGGNMLGIYQAFRTLQERGLLHSMPRLYPVLLKDYKGGFLSSERRLALEHAVQATSGRIIEVFPTDQTYAQTSFEGNTAYQAYLDNKEKLGKTVVLFTGRIWPKNEPQVMPIYSSLTQLQTNFSL